MSLSIARAMSFCPQMLQSNQNILISSNRQFYYDKKIPIYNLTNTEDVFKQNIIKISDQIEDMIRITYSNIDYLSSDYMTKFMTHLNQNITAILDANKTDYTMFLGTLNYVK